MITEDHRVLVIGTLRKVEQGCWAWLRPPRASSTGPGRVSWWTPRIVRAYEAAVRMTESQNARNVQSAQFAEIARELAHGDGSPEVLLGLVRVAVRTVPLADTASVTVVRGRTTFETVAATDPSCSLVDRAQYETGEGPCLEALVCDAVLVCDLAVTDRWPAFAPRAVALGVRSILAVRLFAAEHLMGSLNFFASEPDVFDDEAVEVAKVFAVHAALAWFNESELEGARLRSETQNVIGVAQGILMVNRNIDQHAAFALLIGASQRTNRKVRDVARSVVTGQEDAER